MHLSTIDIQSLQTHWQQSKQTGETSLATKNIATKLQHLFLPFFTQNRTAITITLKKTVQKRAYRLKISKKMLSLYLLAPEEQLHYYFHEEQAPREETTLNFKPEKFHAFSEQMMSILADLKADKTLVSEYSGGPHATI